MFVCALVLSLLGVVLTKTNEPVLFPLPKAYVAGKTATCGNFIQNHVVTADSKDDINSAKNYLNNISKYIFYNNIPASGEVTNIETIISKTETTPIEADQGYAISFSGSKITVNADSIFAAYYAYETLAQLIKYDDDDLTYVIYKYSIQDSPRFKWRGLLIDTARHFHPVSSIQRQVLALAAAKMNVLHWHIADAESFSWKPDNTPEMSNGAYRNGKLYYTSQDVKKIIDFARSWGVEVIIEIDTPGHVYSWKKAHPEIVADCPSYEHNIDNLALDVSQEETYTIAAQIYNELIDLNGKFVHMGGDEVVTGCWKEDPDTKAKMSNEGIGVYDLWEQYETKMDQLINEKAVPIFWQETFQYGALKNSRKTAIIQSWEDQETLGDIVKAGYRGILSGGWYLDQQVPAEDEETHYAFYETWKDFFRNEPLKNLNLTAEQEELVLGGEAAMWGEGIDVGAIDTFVWPRALAVSERLWIDKNITDEDGAKERIQAQRCILLKRGIAAGPIGNNEPCEGQFEYWNYVQYNGN